jgi:DNA modification methylase
MNKQNFKVDFMDVTAVIPYEENPRQIGPDAVAKVAKSIKKYGFVSPIIVNDENVVLAGHTRLQAAISLGLKQVPVHTKSGLSEAAQRAYRLADNRVAEESRWDFPMLTEELSFLKDDDFDLTFTGFDPDELDKYLGIDVEDGLTDADETPELADDPVTVMGDIWQLGNHRLLCGDATKIDEVEKVMDGVKANLFLTDPPYEVTPTSVTHYSGDGMIKGGWMGKDYPVNQGKMFDVPAFSEWVLACLPSMAENSDCYIMSNDRNLSDIMGAAMDNGWRYHNILIWQKPNGIPNRWYFKDIEFTFYGFIGKAKTINIPASTCTYKCKHEQNKEHMSQKPVELFEHYILNSTNTGDFVLEPFGGSGTAVIACEQTNRNCRVMEIEPKYCDVIIKRWQNFTGKAATLNGSGQTFEELEAKRCKAA